MKVSIDDFLKHCEIEKKLSSKTLKAYGIDLKQFYYFLEQNNCNVVITEIDKHILKSYIYSLSGFSPKTIVSV